LQSIIPYLIEFALSDSNHQPQGTMGMASTRKEILCIENDFEAAGLIASDLIHRGFAVRVAHDGQKGLLAILKDKPDLILCDLDLPIMSGFDILERLNEIAPNFGHIPFVLVTGSTDRASELKARQLGADDYVTKPVDVDRLVLIMNARLAVIARSKLPPKPVGLNPREIEILTLAARGKTSAEIARKLRLSKRTVDFHVDNARIKLGGATRTEAVIKAASRGLIKS
jgi:DNA-binding NarL/FixJ family response regulator